VRTPAAWGAATRFGTHSPSRSFAASGPWTEPPAFEFSASTAACGPAVSSGNSGPLRPGQRRPGAVGGRYGARVNRSSRGCRARAGFGRLVRNRCLRSRGTLCRGTGTKGRGRQRGDGGSRPFGAVALSSRPAGRVDGLPRSCKGGVGPRCSSPSQPAAQERNRGRDVRGSKIPSALPLATHTRQQPARTTRPVVAPATACARLRRRGTGKKQRRASAAQRQGAERAAARGAGRPGPRRDHGRRRPTRTRRIAGGRATMSKQGAQKRRFTDQLRTREIVTRRANSRAAKSQADQRAEQEALQAAPPPPPRPPWATRPGVPARRRWRARPPLYRKKDCGRFASGRAGGSLPQTSMETR